MTVEEELHYYRTKYKNEARTKPDTYFRYIRNGKRYKAKLPTLVRFITFGTGMLIKPELFKTIAFRKPLKGEYFLSGSIPEAYIALNDLTSEYIIVEKEVNAV